MNATKTKNADALKDVMRQLPFPVTIVTAAVGQEQRGITIGSFTSLSLDPPLISFNVDFAAQMNQLIKKAKHFAVHIPGTEQAHLCDHFAIPDQSGEEQFGSISYKFNGNGIPILKDIPTVIHCRGYTWFEAGDHTIIVGEVLDIDQHKETDGLLYYDRSYRSVGKRAEEI